MTLACEAPSMRIENLPLMSAQQYISTEDAGIETSASLLRDVLGRCIEHGRAYARSGEKEELFEAFRLLGTGLHCLEDYAAHSNYTELALIEMGEEDVFPMVGSNTMIELPGAEHPVYPVVTGTFGGTDFLHSVMGELNDKATQSELQSLELAIEQSENEPPSSALLGKLLDRLPSSLFGGKDDDKTKIDEFHQQAQQAQEEGDEDEDGPLEPERWVEKINKLQEKIYPIMEWHDRLVQRIDEMIEKIPVIPKLIEQLKEQITIFVFS
ncbi:hypothetical protein KEM55_000953, partial [Ascosphaera atra]